MNTNAWVRVTDTLAQTWRTWALWYQGAQEGPEPPLSDFAKGFLQHVVDWPFAFNAYKTALIDSVEWRMGSVHGVTKEQLQDGYAVYPDEWGVVGYWTWKRDDAQSAIDDAFPLKWADALLFMPDVCADPPDCASMVPATEVTDVSLLAGQPPRDLSLETRAL